MLVAWMEDELCFLVASANYIPPKSLLLLLLSLLVSLVIEYSAVHWNTVFFHNANIKASHPSFVLTHQVQSSKVIQGDLGLTHLLSRSIENVVCDVRVHKEDFVG